MVDVNTALIGVSLILFFGFFAEFLFKKTGIPDVLLLIILGFALGPYGLKYANPAQLESFAPIFTTFTLLFLLYAGAFNIDLASFAKGITKSLKITMFNFIISVVVVTAIMVFIGVNILVALLTGVILGGICSAFVIPVLKGLKVEPQTYSILTLESAITDVLSIVLALTVMEVIKLNTFSAQVTISKIISIFAVAGFIGIIAGIIWITLVTKVFKEHKSYMITLAYLILVYVITEFLKGNGALATLFMGLILRNSNQLTNIAGRIVNEKTGGDSGITVISESEEFFYSQISFFLKTFFFVYIGILINLKEPRPILIGFIVSVVLMGSRRLSTFVSDGFSKFDRAVINSMSARGLASAAMAQLLVTRGIPDAVLVTNVTYAVIIFSIALSSVSIFWSRRTAQG